MHSNVMIFFLGNRIIYSHPVFVYKRKILALPFSQHTNTEDINKNDWSSHTPILLRYVGLSLITFYHLALYLLKKQQVFMCKT